MQKMPKWSINDFVEFLNTYFDSKKVLFFDFIQAFNCLDLGSVEF